MIKKRKSKQNLAPVFVNDDCLAQGFPEGDFNGKTVQGVRRDPEKHSGHATISVLEKHRYTRANKLKIEKKSLHLVEFSNFVEKLKKNRNEKKSSFLFWFSTWPVT